MHPPIYVHKYSPARLSPSRLAFLSVQLRQCRPQTVRSVTTQNHHSPESEATLPPSLLRVTHSDSNLEVRKSNVEGPGQSDKAPQHYRRSLLDKELEWIKDPLKLADRVVHLMDKNDENSFEKAVALVQRASKSMYCTVSWNHLINHEMRQGTVKNAVKLYNDVGCTPLNVHELSNNKPLMRFNTDEKASSGSRCAYFYDALPRF